MSMRTEKYKNYSETIGASLFNSFLLEAIPVDCFGCSAASAWLFTHLAGIEYLTDTKGLSWTALLQTRVRKLLKRETIQYQMVFKDNFSGFSSGS